MVIHDSTWLARFGTGRWMVFFCFLLLFGIYCACSVRLVQRYEVTGDEPHYLLIAHSLAYDGDLDLANNFQNHDYREFHTSELRPEVDHQAIDVLGNGVIHSKHDIGLPLIIAPFYRIAGRLGVLVFHNLVTALTIALCYRWVYTHVGNWTIPVLVCLGLGCSVPTLAFSTQVYPEAVAAFLVLWGMYQLDFLKHSRISSWRLVGYSAVIGFLPWLSTKYVVISAVFALAGLFLLCSASWRGLPKAILLLLVPALVSALIWIYVRIRFYGTLSPAAQYADFQFSLASIYQHSLGMLFDQEHGLLPYSPMYVLAPIGLVIMWRAGRRFMALFITVTFCVFFGLIASWHAWWGGWCLPARFLTVILPILSLPLGYASKAVFQTRRALVPLASLVIGLMVIGVLLGFFGMYDPLYRLLNRRDGAANLFLDLGPRYFDWASVLPSYPPVSPVVRFWASGEASQVGDDVIDPIQESGMVRFAPSGSPPGYLVKEAKDTLAAGRYRVCAEIGTDGYARGVGMLEAATITSQPRQNVFSLSIDGSASASLFEYQWKCGELWVDHRDLMGFSFWFTGADDVYLRTLSCERLGPWSPTLYTVADGLDFASDSVAPYLGAGWSREEPWGRWAIGRLSVVYVHLEKRIDTSLTMIVFPYHVEGATQQIWVYYNDQLLDKFSLSSTDAQEVSTIIPGSFVTKDVDVLRFDYAYARSPAEDGLSGDQRVLAVGFVTLELSPLQQANSLGRTW